MNEVTTVRLDASKNNHHPNNIQGVARISSLLSYGWELAGSVLIGEDVVVFMRLKRRRWRFWRKQELPSGMKSYPVYRH